MNLINGASLMAAYWGTRCCSIHLINTYIQSKFIRAPAITVCYSVASAQCGPNHDKGILVIEGAHFSSIIGQTDLRDLIRVILE